MSARLPCLLAVAALLAGCAAPAPPRSALALRAIELNGEGVERYQGRDYARAASLFEQALTLERAGDNEDGVALNLLNLAQVLQAQGKPAEAEQRLDAVLDEAGMAFAPARRLQAQWQKALLALQRRELAGALRWHAAAERSCARTCAQAGQILNLGARLALEQGEAGAAVERATAALAHNRAGADGQEVANSLRLLAAGQLALARPALARPALAEALALDKRNGASDKIYQDLLLLGRASGDTLEQRRYWLRAQGVARAAGLEQAARDIAALLAGAAGAIH